MRPPPDAAQRYRLSSHEQALHRHELLWERPAEFDPMRFDPSNGERRDKYQYLPFGAGPRVCVGANFAMMQAQIILATLIQRFRFHPSLPAPKPVMMMTVRLCNRVLFLKIEMRACVRHRPGKLHLPGP